MKTIIRFDAVSYAYEDGSLILDETSFSVREELKVALMGQNGAGKSTLFKLLTGTLKPTEGRVSVDPSLTVATAHQVIDPEEKDLTIEEFFTKRCNTESYDVKRRMAGVLEAVNLHAPADKKIRSFSGGQQARLLLASALIQDPDLLLLDEPTNNLDADGINHLIYFLMVYPKSVIVISHDAEFLNSFTQGVLYLDSYTKKIEQYAGNYMDVVEEINARIETQQRLNAQRERGIVENKEKANFFANKGGKMRNVAKKMREKIEQLENEKVDVRREDKTIRNFTFPIQKDLPPVILTISSVSVIVNHEVVKKPAHISLSKGKHLLVEGPNGIGKSTLIDAIAKGKADGVTITPGVRTGYYSQDFSQLEYNDTVFDSLKKAVLLSDAQLNEQNLRAVAAGFLLTGDLMAAKVKSLSEGQKGLLSFARLVLLQPGLLILDEPTNHINFRHIPVIAQAISGYTGALILISHIPEFVSQIKIHERLDLEK